MNTFRLALDRSVGLAEPLEIAVDFASVRSYDSDGHLHIDTANISKATVNGYYGREIPKVAGVDLEPDRLYKLFRDPAELQAGAATFARKPILIVHTGITADDHPHEKVIGTIGSDSRFESPYLKSSLTFWDGDAIKLIESGKQRALSCGYRYVPVWEPGVFEGQAYDGRMTKIEANHLALVVEGRAGPDIIVGDQQPPKEGSRPYNSELTMPTIVLSRKANLAHGAVLGLVHPLLATDAKLPDLTSAFAGVTKDNFATSRPSIAGKIAEILKDKLAADKNLDALPKFLAGLDAMDPAEEAEDEEDDEEERKKKEAEDKAARDKAAKDAKAAKDKAAKDEEEREKERKEAQDAAIKTAIDKAREEAKAEARATAQAKDAVEAALGRVTAMDSAVDYYRAGLKALDVKDADKLPEAALEATFTAVAAVKKSIPVTPGRAFDVKPATEEFSKRFPNNDRLARV